MHSLFHSPRSPEPRTHGRGPRPDRLSRKIEGGADLAAVFAGQTRCRRFLRPASASARSASSSGLLDAAGRREYDNRGILAATQEIFRGFGTELVSRSDINESESMTELSLRLNRGLIDHSSAASTPCPAFIACYHEAFGTLCYSNAGHTPGLLRDSSGIVELDSTGLAPGTVLPRHRRCPYDRH